MPRPKDAKVWNEKLVAALEARYEQSLREGKRNAHTWQKGAGQIAAVRSDIYCFSSGRIANLPNGLSKTVMRLCEDIIRGVKNVYPDGHVPSNGGAGSAASYGYGGAAGTAAGYGYGGGAVSAASVASPVRSRGNVVGGVSCTNCGSSDVERHSEAQVFLCTDCGNVIESAGNASYSPAAAVGVAPAAAAQGNNPFSNDNYMRKIKIRGGAFAILMAFHHSQTDVLLKRQIIAEGQKFCDEQMEANYMAGRPHGAWSGIKTLKDHNFITEEGKAQYTDRGWRSAPHKFTLTRDGKMFIEALLTNRPEAEAARRQAAGVGAGARSTFSSPGMRVGGGGGAYASPVRHTLSHVPPGARIIGHIGGDFPISGSMRTYDNVERDRAELEDWMATAQVGESKIFNVGKDRRLKLHRLCDSLMAEHPGLVLTHGSIGEGRSRALTIQLVRMPTGAAGTAQKRSYSQSDGFSGYAQASTSSESSAAKRSRTYTPAQNAAMAAIKRQEQAEIAKEDEDMKKALAESAKMAASATPKRRPTDNSGVEVIDGYDDEEEAVMQRVMQESLRESERKRPAKNSEDDVVDIADSDDEDDRKKPTSSDSARRKIDLSKSNDDEEDDDNIIEINDSQDEPIDLLDSQPQALGGDTSDDDSLPPASGLHSPPLTGKKSSASSATKALKKKTANNDSDDDEIVLLENNNEDAHTTSASDETLNAHIARMRDYVLSVMIDNRERNRNATPRAMRMELARHFASGPLSAVWPNGWQLAQVEEEKLIYGDFGFSNIHKTTGERNILGISVERKRANDLVQRSYAGDHLTQLRRMLQSCSLAFLLIEYDTRLTSSMTAYDANDREGFDPLDSTITCEEDVYRMFGRALFTSDSIRFIQTKDEQASLRSVGALGLVATSAPEIPEEQPISKRSISAQALQDLLKQGGIPWKMAQRVARAVGGIDDLTKLYDSCCDDDAKSNLLSHIVSLDGDDQLQGDLRSTAKGWSEAVYRILMDHVNGNNGFKLNGEAALLLHKELIEDHGQYLNILYKHGCTPDEALDRALSSSARAMSDTPPSRSVAIHLTKDQATQYFPSSGNAEEAFYKLNIAPDETSKDGPIVLRAVSGRHASKSLLVYEMEGSIFTDIVQNAWESFSDDRNFLGLADRIAQRVDTQCRMPRRIESSYQRVLLVCGLSPALDALARVSGYRLETRTVVDMVLSNLMIRRNMAVIQALRKNTEDRVKVVQQLALACFHCGLLTEKHPM